jgi:hypothetical protein
MMKAGYWFAALAAVAAIAIGGQATALEVRSPSGPPVIVIKVPDGSVVDASKPTGTIVYLQANSLPFVVISMVSGDMSQYGPDQPGYLDRVALATLKGLEGPAAHPVQGVKARALGRPANIYHDVLGSGDKQADVELVVTPIDATHVAVMLMLGKHGDPSTALMHQAMMAATLSAH